MTTQTLTLRPAMRGDVPFFLELERLPSSGVFVTLWNEEQHLAAQADTGFAVLVGEDAAGEPRGFLLFGGLDDDHGNVCLMRIIVDRPGEGLGGVLMDLAADWVFTETDCHRLWLDVLVENTRGRRVYERHGFTHEGTFRQSFGLPGGGRTDCHVMSLLRPEWESRRLRS